ncbi:MAG: hypothetical protein HYS17_01595 [Micavibrio aeruginosavorus]|uniref:Uncharacterized protein n=1 Tax=Micavibrio aeruginosavorus TaxID=349221 RepID=A0A7T5R2W1_9BACT|nr:MAG: hypothetical protein HYS17_01595 [Micavibrio aeruginosavorus]
MCGQTGVIDTNGKRRLSRTVLTIAFSGMVAGFTSSLPAHAQTACDPQFMDAIEARGFVEAARENAQNQNLIYKPDGVFEYSCFRDHVPAVQSNAVSLFRPASLTSVTTTPVDTYVFESYQDVFLNSRYVDPGLAAPPAGMCNAIASVWEAARCINFYDRANIDGLFDLSFYTGGEPRILPPSMGACTALPYSKLNMALDVAYNNETSRWVMPPDLNDTTDYIADPVDPQTDMYTPAVCQDPIPTGMIVIDYNSPMGTTPFPEKICANPACVYMPDSDDCSMP